MSFQVFSSIPVTSVYGLTQELDDKVTSNPPITPGTNTKITYDEKGLVTSSTEASLGDLSNVEDVIESSNLATLRVLASPGFDTNFKYIDWTPAGGGGGGAYSASNVGTGTGVFSLLIGNNFTFHSIGANSSSVSVSLISETIRIDVVPSNFSGIPQTGVTNLVSDLASKLTANPAITPGTNTKITYDSDGLVLSGTQASLADLSNVNTTPVSNSSGTLRVLASPGANTLFEYVDWTPPATIYSCSNLGSGTIVFSGQVGNNFQFHSIGANSSSVSVSLISETIRIDVVPSNFSGIPQSGVTNLISDLASKLTANPAITPGTNTKITYDSDGLVLSGTQASLADLSNVNTTPVSNSSGTLRVLASPGANTLFEYVDWTPPATIYTCSNLGTGTIVFSGQVGNNFQFHSIGANSSSVSVSLISETIRIDVVPSNFSGIPQTGVTNLVSDLASKLTANAPITPGTNTKITYDSDGLVLSGTQASLADLSNVNTTPASNSSGTLRVLASPGANTLFQYIDWTPPPSPVTSVFGRTGAVTAASGDYNISQITNSSVLASTSNVTITSPVSGQLLRYNGTVWSNFTPPYGNGTVTSVGLSMPSIFTVISSPVTTSGTIGVVLTSQSVNTVFAAPTGGSGAPLFRSLVVADLPTFTQNSILFAGVGGVISQSNSSLAWNDTTKVLTVSNAATSIPSTGGVVTTLSGPLTILNGTNDSFRFISALDTSLAASGTRSIAFGRAASQYNQAELTFSYAGLSSTSNALNIGLNSVNCIQVTPVQVTNNIATKFSSTIVDNSNSTGTSGQVLTSTGTGVQWSTANTSFITFCTGANLSNNQYLRPFAGMGGGTFSQNCIIIPRSCTITAITAGLSVAPGGVTRSWIFTLYRNGVATALTVSVTGVATVSNRATGSISCSLFDTIAIFVTKANVPANSVGYLTLEYL